MLIRIGFSILVVPLLSSCGIQIAGKRIPFKNACGSLAPFKCRAQGLGPRLGTDSTILKKERINLAGHNHYLLGQTIDVNEFNDIRWAISLKRNEDYVVETGNVEADFKTTKIRRFTALLDAELKKQDIQSDIKAKVTNEFYSKLEDLMVVELQFHVATLKPDLIKNIDLFIEDGVINDERIPALVRRIKLRKKPLIRQVLAIEENISFEGNGTVKNILDSSFKAAGVEPRSDASATLVINAFLTDKEVKNINSETKLLSAYSIGLFKRRWMGLESAN